MSVVLCDRCGEVVVAPATCLCRSAYDAVEVRRRHGQALRRARTTDRARAAERTRPAA